MNAVRSPEDIMPAIPPAGAAAPRVNPLQRIWLREIGMEVVAQARACRSPG